MKKIILIIIFTLFNISVTYAKDNSYPDANNFIYPEYEVKAISDFKNSFKNLKFGEIVDAALNLNYDIEKNKNKFLAVTTVILLWKQFEILPMQPDNKPFPLKFDKVNKFIEENENLKSYDGASVWKKILVWSFLKPSVGDPAIYRLRRHKLLLDIIENSKEYAPLISYVLIFNDEYYDYADEHNKRDYEIIQEFINKYPNTEFAAQAQLELASLYSSKGNREKTIQLCEDLIKKYDNFYTGTSDFYSKTYGLLAYIYRKQNNMEKVTFFMDIYNKKAPYYEQIRKEFLAKKK